LNYRKKKTLKLLIIAGIIGPITKRWDKKWGYVSFCLGILSLTSGPVMFIKILDNFVGLVQRLGIGFSLLWIFLVSLKIYNNSKNKSNSYF
jgi:hypothetical protein